MSNIFQRAWSSFKSYVFPGAGGVANGQTNGVFGDLFSMRLPGAQIDYRREAGLLWQNVVVLACIMWLGRVTGKAPLCVRKYEDDESGDKVPQHPVAKLIRRPNAYYTGRDLWKATWLSLLVDGNCYWYKRRSAAGKVVELWWIPHFLIEPRWPDDGSEFISFYQYKVNGKSYVIPVEDIIHFRYGIDPINNRKGLAPLSAALRSIVSINQAESFTASILMNGGVISLILSPTGEDEIGDADAKKIKKDFKAQYRGEQRGDVMVMTAPMKLDKPGYSPEELRLREILDRPEANVLAPIGISAMVIGLNVGDAQRTYSNYKEAQEAAWETCIEPMQGDLADTLDAHLLPELGNEDGEECYFDVSQVRSLQPDKAAIWKRAVDAFRYGAISRGQAKAEMGLDHDPDEDDLYAQAGKDPNDPDQDEDEDRTDGTDEDDTDKKPSKRRKALAA